MKVDKVEHVSRIMAKALHARLSPDTKVFVTEPQMHGFPNNFAIAPPSEHCTPLWALYVPAARAIVDEIDRRAAELF